MLLALKYTYTYGYMYVYYIHTQLNIKPPRQPDQQTDLLFKNRFSILVTCKTSLTMNFAK